MNSTEADIDKFYILLDRGSNEYTIGMRREDCYWTILGIEGDLPDKMMNDYYEVLLPIDIEEFIANESASR